MSATGVVSTRRSLFAGSSFCDDVGLGVLECFSALEDAYMRMDILIVEIRHVDSLENFSKVDHTVGVIVGIGFVSGFVS